MIWRYFEPLLAPFRKARSSGVKAKNIKGNARVEANRVKGYGKLGKNKAKAAKDKAGQAKGQAGEAGAQGQEMAAQAQVGGAPPGQAAPPPAGGVTQQTAPPAGGAPGAQGSSPASAKPGIAKVGLFRRKHVCEQCSNEVPKDWDHCPHCAQVAAAANKRTQAFMVDVAGAGAGIQMLGWLVPVQGAQRGELYTLAPQSVIGTEPTCTVVLTDPYMSSRHAEIRAENGVWILQDMGSTNGTFVNNNRIDQHELVDNDFVTFGQTLVKFKSL